MKTMVTMLGALAFFAMAKARAAPAENDAACESMAKVHASVHELSQLGPDATLGDVRKSAEQVRTDYKTFAKEAKKAAPPQAENLRSSLENLREAVRSMPDAMTIHQSKEVVSGAVDQVKTADRQLANALGCERVHEDEH
jgi:hypothetical protein